MTRRAAAAAALLAGGLLLLATTQPWVLTVSEVAPGAPRTRGAVGGAELVPWLAPVALVTALALVAGLSGMRWARPVAVLASVVVLGGAARAVVAATSGGPASAGLVSSTPTGWLWTATAAALGTTVATVLSCWGAGSRRRVGDRRRVGPRRPADDPHGSEAERRRAAADWRDLSEGRDPTER